MRYDGTRRRAQRSRRLAWKTVIMGTGFLLAPLATGCLSKIMAKLGGGAQGPALPSLSAGSGAALPQLGNATALASALPASTAPAAPGPASSLGPAAPGTGDSGLPGSDASVEPMGEGVLQKLDIPYGNRHERQKLDLYLPAQGGRHPVVVFIHGGGFMGGDKSQARGFEEFVRQGYALASVNYTLGSGSSPLQMRDALVRGVADVRQAVRYLRASAGEHGLDPGRIAVFGVSAGGYYAAMLGAVGDRKVAEFDQGGSGGSAAVQVVVEFAGPTDFASYPGGAVASLASLPGVADQLARTLPPSVLPYVGGRHPPTRIIHGRNDPVVPLAQSQQYHRALKQAGVTAELEILEGAGHSIPDAVKRQQIEAAIAYVRRHLG